MSDTLEARSGAAGAEPAGTREAPDDIEAGTEAMQALFDQAVETIAPGMLLAAAEGHVAEGEMPMLSLSGAREVLGHPCWVMVTVHICGAGDSADAEPAASAEVSAEDGAANDDGTFDGASDAHPHPRQGFDIGDVQADDAGGGS